METFCKTLTEVKKKNVFTQFLYWKPNQHLFANNKKVHRLISCIKVNVRKVVYICTHTFLKWKCASSDINKLSGVVCYISYRFPLNCNHNRSRWSDSFSFCSIFILEKSTISAFDFRKMYTPLSYGHLWTHDGILMYRFCFYFSTINVRE